MESLIHCIYASAATVEFDASQLAMLLEQARTSNADAGITGMLIHAEGSFFQVLEGDAHRVESLVAKIKADPRHEKVTEIIREPIPRRAFGDWTMGYARMTREDFAAIDGLNDFFGRASCLARIDAGRARKLLGRFAAGRWRLCSGTAPDRMAAA